MGKKIRRNSRKEFVEIRKGKSVETIELFEGIHARRKHSTSGNDDTRNATDGNLRGNSWGTGW
jgi:hypothetical protein